LNIEYRFALSKSDEGVVLFDENIESLKIERLKN
jgi:hypothetical protein